MIISLGGGERNISKKAIFPLTKYFGLFFLVPSSVRNLTGQFVGVQQVFDI